MRESKLIKMALDFRNNAKTQIQQIQANSDLNATAKSNQIGQLRAAANAKLAEMKKAYELEGRNLVAAAHTAAFQLGHRHSATDLEKAVAAESLRVAQRHAMSLPDDKAMNDFARLAASGGDKISLTALASVAWQKGWARTLQTVADGDAGLNERMGALREAETSNSNPNDQMAVSISFAQIS